VSLAAVHLLFISLSVLLSAACGLWGIRAFVADANATGLAFGILSLLAVPVLLVYGVRVRRKLKDLGAFS